MGEVLTAILSLFEFAINSQSNMAYTWHKYMVYGLLCAIQMVHYCSSEMDDDVNNVYLSV